MANVQELIDETLGLQHYGIKGQKWGKRRYQNEDGTYTEEGKKRRRVGYTEEAKEDEKSDNKSTSERIVEKTFKEMTRKERRAAKKKARHDEKARKERREFNEKKKQAIEDGDIRFISDNIKRFSNEEIDEAAKRYKKMSEIWKMDKDSRKDAEYFVDKALKYLNKAGDATKTITDMYKNINSVKQANIDYKKKVKEYEKLKKSKSSEIEEEQLRQERELTRQMRQKTNVLRLVRSDAKDHPYWYKEVLEQVNISQPKKGKTKKANKSKKGDNNNQNNNNNNNNQNNNRSARRGPRLATGYYEEHKGLIDGILSKFRSKDSDSIAAKPSKKTVKAYEDVDNYNKKWLSKLDKQYSKYSTVSGKTSKEDKKRIKEMHTKKYSYVYDKWVRDMKRKYIAEGLSPEVAERKAENYVDSWVDAYDEGRITGLKK